LAAFLKGELTVTMKQERKPGGEMMQ